MDWRLLETNTRNSVELSGYLDLHSPDTSDSYLVAIEEEGEAVTSIHDLEDHTWTEVSEDVFKDFVQCYRAVRKLEFNCGAISEPPVCSYNDFELDPMWPGSMVAKFVGWPKDEDKKFYLRDGVEIPGEGSMSELVTPTGKIMPTIGRMMHYHTSKDGNPLTFPAIVTAIHPPHEEDKQNVNLTVFGRQGVPAENVTEIRLVQPGDGDTVLLPYCEWPPRL